MNFNSPQYLIFLPIVFFIYLLFYQKDKTKINDLVLLIASYVFYMSWNWRYAGLIAFSTIIDYVLGDFLSKTKDSEKKKRKTLLVISLVSNLGLLGFFKYHNFFIDCISPIWNLTILKHDFLLPVGISFYTFQTLSYTIDLYRKEIEHERNFIKYALFVSFFPQLVAGPIVRAVEFLPQLKSKPILNEYQMQEGLLRIFKGLFKKIVLADLLANFGVDTVFLNPSEFSALELILAVYGYSFQIYNDFSGYSDIAIGSAALFGYKLPENFNKPYLSLNVREFWTRWHISLSTWLRDYLYIPLGGNRNGGFKTYRNLMITMLLGGLWHGASLNFVFWGAWHGILLCLSRSQNRNSLENHLSVQGKFIKRFFTFQLIAFSWLLFRIQNFTKLKEYLSGIVSSNNPLTYTLSKHFLIILLLAFICHFIPKDFEQRFSNIFIKAPFYIQGAFLCGLILLFLTLTMSTPAFIYFQF